MSAKKKDCAPRAKGAINMLLKTSLPRRSAHAINDARARLRAVGHEQHIFSDRNTRWIVVSKLKEETQAKIVSTSQGSQTAGKRIFLEHGLRLKGGQQ